MSRTLLIVKPDATARNLTGYIMARLEKARFQVVGLRLLTMSEDQARQFYAVHKDQPFYETLVRYMTSGPVVPMALEKENAVPDLRALIGVTNPQEAACGTLRYDIGVSIEKNSVHASDSDDNAAREIAFFFSDLATS